MNIKSNKNLTSRFAKTRIAVGAGTLSIAAFLGAAGAAGATTVHHTAVHESEAKAALEAKSHTESTSEKKAESRSPDSTKERSVDKPSPDTHESSSTSADHATLDR
jgi:hypothetical protein